MSDHKREPDGRGWVIGWLIGFAIVIAIVCALAADQIQQLLEVPR